MGNTPSYSRIAQLQWYNEGKSKFTRAGYEKHAASFEENIHEVGEKNAYHNKVVLVLGGNKGFGFECAVAAARFGARAVHIVSRSHDKNEEALAVLKERFTPKEEETTITPADSADVDVESTFHFHVVNFTLVEEMRRFATQIAEGSIPSLEYIDIIFNNCAYMPQKRTVTSESHEVIAAMIYSSTLLFPAIVLPQLRPNARFINISTSAACLVECNASDIDLVNMKTYDGGLVYAIARKGQVYICETLQQQVRAAHENKTREEQVEPLENCYPQFVSMHPGWSDVQALKNGQPGFYEEHQKEMRTVEMGIDTALWLGGAATTEALASNEGGFWFDRQPYPMDYSMTGTKASREERKALWNAACQYLGLQSLPLAQLPCDDSECGGVSTAGFSSSSCS